MSFNTLNLSSPILKAIEAKGYESPSPIQVQAIPAVLQGRDVMAAAQTGTGKTAGFTLPLLERLSSGRAAKPNQVRALVLTPTRELAAQVSDSVIAYGQNLPLRSAVVFGGVKINPQMMKLRKGVDILVATPGRLLDLHTKNALQLDQVEILVLDEADRMLDMGFNNDIRKILELLPRRRQNLMFSATFSKEIRQLAKGLVNDPVEISVTPENSTAKTVSQEVIPVDKSNKSALLIALIKDEAWFQVLVFCRTKHGANKLSHQLNKAGIGAAPIHGNKSQGARTRALAEFKKGDLQVLVATDIAARGLDIDQLPQVVNFDLPHVSEDYVHRIGRTGRAGAEGRAVSLVCAAEYKELVGIERLIQEHIPRRTLSKFVPSEVLPDSPKQLKPIKPKKPKKNKKANQGQKDQTSSQKSTSPHVKESQKKPAQNRSSRNKAAVNKTTTDKTTVDKTVRDKTSGNKRGPEKRKAAKKSDTKKQANKQIWDKAAKGTNNPKKTTKAANKPKQTTNSASVKGNSSTRQGNSTERNANKASSPARKPRKRPAKKPG